MSRIEVASEVTGNVWKIESRVGDQVGAGHVLMIIESMKMEIPIEAECGGTISEILVREEDAVVEDQVVAIIET